MFEAAWNFFLQNWNAGVEILIIAAVLYYIYINLRGTHGARILFALALILITLTLISLLLNLAVIGWMLRSFSVFLAVALVVIFQPELRRALTQLGSHAWFVTQLPNPELPDRLVDTVLTLRAKNFGALIAIQRQTSLRNLVDGGTDLDALFSNELLLTLFHPKTMLHDGGVLIVGNRVAAAGCVFPLTQKEDLDRNLGLRHRAALGLCEASDAVCLVVSEETGTISLCVDSKIERDLQPDLLKRRLEQLILKQNDVARSAS